jgi:hypothetical protein
LISACDKLHNLRAIAADRREIGDAVFDRFKPTADETRANYADLIAVFEKREALPAPLLSELHRALTDIGEIGAAAVSVG